MNPRLKTALMVFVGLAAASIAYVTLRPNSTDPEDAAQITAPINQDIETSENTAMTGTYVGYSPEQVAATTGQKVLFFHAPWCPQCRSIESGMTPGSIPAGITIFKVDYDTNQALRQKYGVTLQTTFVKIDDQGNLVDKYVAYDNPIFPAVKEKFL